jgi:hypothetical protein
MVQPPHICPVLERKVVNLHESGCTLKGYNPETETLEVIGLDGHAEYWGPPTGKSYALKFLNREFEFICRVKPETPHAERRRRNAT